MVDWEHEVKGERSCVQLHRSPYTCSCLLDGKLCPPSESISTVDAQRSIFTTGTPLFRHSVQESMAPNHESAAAADRSGTAFDFDKLKTEEVKEWLASPDEIAGFILAENDSRRPTVRHDQYTDPNSRAHEVPIIDVGLIRSGSKSERHKLTKAVEEWGFFKIINHGIPLELGQEVERQSLKLFALPRERKLLADRDARGMGYLPKNLGKPPWDNESASLRVWAESANITFEGKPRHLETFSATVFETPEEAETFRDTYNTWRNKCAELGRDLLENMLLGLELGIDTKEVLELFAPDQIHVTVKLNRYPPCPEPEKVIGLYSHRDPQILTILYQDQTGGLQVMNKGEYVPISPDPVGSLVVNVGSTLQAWSNDRFTSVFHHAVANSEKTRFSVACFLSTPPDAMLRPWPIPQLVDKEHPQKYRALSISEVFANFNKHSRQPTFTQGDRSAWHVIDYFRL